MSAENDNKELPKCVTPPLPDGTEPLEHQVAGHRFGQGKNKYGILKCWDGTLLKPCQEPPRGLRELEFYQWIDSSERTEEDLVQLRQFLPNFLGTWSTPQNPNVLFMKMGDLTTCFNHPCIADAKVGPITYDPDASEDKKAKEIAKFKDLPIVGFRFTGIRVFNFKTLKYEVLENDPMKLFTAEEVFSRGMEMFLNKTSVFSNMFINMSFLRRLLKLKKWFMMQSRLKFIASSVLLVYEGDVVEQNYSCDACKRLAVWTHSSPESCEDSKINGGIDQCNNGFYSTRNSMYFTERTCDILKRISTSICNKCDSLTEMKMIDFAHVFPSDTLDENYLFGLNGLISHFVHALITWNT